MKRIVSFLIAILLCVCFSGIANARDDHEITMLNLLESMIQDMFYEAYYDEEKDVFVITYKNENITKEKYDKYIDFNPDFDTPLAELCRTQLYQTYRDWMDLFNIDIDIIIRHVTSDNGFMYCLINEKYSKTDVAKVGTKREEIDIQVIKLFMQVIKESFNKSGSTNVECGYDEEKDEIWLEFYMGEELSLTDNYSRRNAKESLRKIHEIVEEKITEGGVIGVNICISFVDESGTPIMTVVDGE